MKKSVVDDKVLSISPDCVPRDGIKEGQRKHWKDLSTSEARSRFSFVAKDSGRDATANEFVRYCFRFPVVMAGTLAHQPAINDIPRLEQAYLSTCRSRSPFQPQEKPARVAIGRRYPGEP